MTSHLSHVAAGAVLGTHALNWWRQKAGQGSKAAEEKKNAEDLERCTTALRASKDKEARANKALQEFLPRLTAAAERAEA